MCDPLTIAGLALTAGSTVANYSANQQVEKARADALAAERIRQAGLDQQAAALNVSSQDRYQDFGGQEDTKAKELGDYFAGMTVPQNVDTGAGTTSGLPSSGSNIVVDEENRQRAQAHDFTTKTGMALGNLRAFGDLLGDLGRGQARDASLIGQIGGFKLGSSGVLPYELDAASHKGDQMKFFGDVLGGLGSVGTSAGLSGGNLFGGGGLFGGNTAGKVVSSAVTPATMSSGLRFARGATAPGLFSLYGRG